MTYSTRIAAGKLRQRIQILKSTGTQDSTGGTSLADYTTLATVWASVEPLSGSETLAADAQTSVGRFQIQMRYMDGITSALQVLFQGRKFQVENVSNPDGRQKKLYLQVVQIDDSVQQ